MNYRLVPSAQADHDTFEIACYLSEQREDLGFRFYDSIDTTYQKIIKNPLWKGVGPFRKPEARNIRICPVKGFSNYLIFYRVVSDRIEILRVLHGARNYMSIFESELPDEEETTP